MTDAPYRGLDPERILDALAGAGFEGDGRLLALNSYENRVYQVWLDDGRVVVAKFYRPGRWSDEQILEEHAFANELVEEEIPVVPPIVVDGTSLLRAEGFRFAVFPRRGGRMPELESPEVLEWLGRFIARIHRVGARRPFAHRPNVDVERLGHESFAFLLAGEQIPCALRPAWRAAAEQALEAADAAFARTGTLARLRLHGDCHAGNVLWTDAGPHFVDLDDACMGPAIQDLWMLLSGDRASMASQLREVVAGYEDFVDFDRRELALVEPLRTLRLLYYSAWIARRWEDPAFPAAFPWFGSERYWQDRILELREQIGAMSEPPLGPI